jgi:hypothetical protein
MSVGDTISIDTGSSAETRKIASLGTAAGNQRHDAVAAAPRRSGDHDSRRLDQRAGHQRGRLRGRREDRPRLWRHLPRGRKGHERYEVATVTAVGKPGTQAYWGGRARRLDQHQGDVRRQHLGRRQDPAGHRQRRPWDRDRHGHARRHAGEPHGELSATTSAGATNIKVRSANGFAVGDKLTVGTPANRETVTITAVGTRVRTAPASTLRRPSPRRMSRRRGVVSGHGPRPGRSAQVQPCGQPALQRSRNGDQLPAGDGLCPLEQRARPGARHRHHARQPLAKTTRSTRLCVTPQSRPRATRERRRPTSGSEAPPSSPHHHRQAWCCATPPAWLSTASTTAASSTHGPPRATRPPPDRAERLPRDCARPGRRFWAGRFGLQRVQYERGPLPDGARHRQQLHRFPDPARHHPVGRFGRGRDQYQSRQRGRLCRWPDDQDRYRREPRNRRHRDGWHAGATTARAATDVGATVIPVASAIGFSEGQTITIDMARTQRRRLSPPPRGLAARNHRCRAAHSRARDRCTGLRHRHHPRPLR